MPGSGRRGGPAHVAIVSVIWALSTHVALGQSAPYIPKNGILNWKAVLIGGGFRVTPAIPLRGDMSKYQRLEIVRTASLIGDDAPESVLNQLTRDLTTEFNRGGRFAATAITESYERPMQTAGAGPEADDSFLGADPIEAPMRGLDDMVAFDRERIATAACGERCSGPTLVVQCQVIDFAKGNRWLQLLALDIGNSVLTLRCSYFDKISGEELGRSVISSDNSSKVIPSAVTSRTPIAGVVDGLVDQVTRRKIAGER